MMIPGQIAKGKSGFWTADCDIAGIHTQGTSKADAMEMLAAAFEDVVDVQGFKVKVTETGEGGEVLVEASDPGRLLAIVLRFQREVHKLSLADVAKALGASSRNAYARYEQGAAMPRLDTVYQMLAAVAPNLTLAFVERSSGKARSKA